MGGRPDKGMAAHLASAIAQKRGGSSAIGLMASAAGVSIVEARGLDQARFCLELVRLNRTVIVQLAALDGPLAQRVDDLIAGGACAIDAQLTRVSWDVLLVQPHWGRIQRG